MRGSVRAAPLLDGSSANALRRPGSNNRAGSSLPTSSGELLGRSAVACGRALRSIEHFLGDDLRLGRRDGTMGDHCRGPVALRRIGVGPTLRLRSAPVEVGPGIVRSINRADAERPAQSPLPVIPSLCALWLSNSEKKAMLAGGCRFFPSRTYHREATRACKKFLQVTSQKVAGEQFYTDAIRPSDLA